MDYNLGNYLHQIRIIHAKLLSKTGMKKTKCPQVPHHGTKKLTTNALLTRKDWASLLSLADRENEIFALWFLRISEVVGRWKEWGRVARDDHPLIRFQIVCKTRQSVLSINSFLNFLD